MHSHRFYFVFYRHRSMQWAELILVSSYAVANPLIKIFENLLYFFTLTTQSLKMKFSLLFIGSLFLSLAAFSQKPSDILENGNNMPRKGVIIFQIDSPGKKINYDLTKSFQDPKDNPLNFIELEDSAIFLPHHNSVNIYAKPWNPLNLHINQEVTYKTDEINEAGATVLGSFKGIPKVTETKKIVGATGKTTESVVVLECNNFNVIEGKLKEIHSRLQDSKKESINSLFSALKAMPFKEEAPTISEIQRLEPSKASIEKYFADVTSLIAETQKLIDDYNCNEPKIFTTQYLFYLMIKDFAGVHEEQKKRVKNLQTAFEMVRKQKDLALNNENGFRWAIKLGEVASNTGKIANSNVVVKTDGYQLSDKGEIVATQPKELVKRNYRLRKFQRFVPEVSAGTAYTFFNYNTYGTTTNANGELVVGEPTKNEVRNINLTTMLNLNFYLENSPVHPLWQIGAGFNQSVPTLLTGIGLRGALGPDRVALTVGLAMTWIKELDKLKPGDQIKGTSDIENDLKHQFTWPPKMYIGIQYGF